jgi:hypothetical protein
MVAAVFLNFQSVFLTLLFINCLKDKSYTNTRIEIGFIHSAFIRFIESDFY